VSCCAIACIRLHFAQCVLPGDEFVFDLLQHAAFHFERGPMPFEGGLRRVEAFVDAADLLLGRQAALIRWVMSVRALAFARPTRAAAPR
jgi:hypothetical protein